MATYPHDILKKCMCDNEITPQLEIRIHTREKYCNYAKCTLKKLFNGHYADRNEAKKKIKIAIQSLLWDTYFAFRRTLTYTEVYIQYTKPLKGKVTVKWILQCWSDL